MPETIFARPRYDYPSYSDFWKLAALSGYDVQYIDEVDYSKPVTVIYSTPDASPEFRNQFAGTRARVVYWMLEWYADFQPANGVEVWNSNETFAHQIGAKFVPLGSHTSLAGNLNGTEKAYDIAHLSYAIPRRQAVYVDLKARNVKVAPNGWGAERHRILSATRMMLQVHQFPEMPAYAPLRAAIAASYQLALVIESGWCVTPLEKAAAVFGYNDLAGSIAMLAQDKYAETVRQLGQRLHDRLCVENTFRSFVEAAL